MARFGEYVICRNQIVRARDGGIPQNDLWPGRGKVAFTVMEARGEKLFHYDEHFARLETCARKIGLPVWSEKEIVSCAGILSSRFSADAKIKYTNL